MSDDKQARAELEAALAEGKQLKAQLRDVGFTQAGFTPAEAKALGRLYRGDPTDTDGIRKFAADEFGWGVKSPEDLAAEQRADGEARLQMLSQGALPARDLGPDDKIAKAEAEGDWETVDRLNVQKLERARAQGQYSPIR